MAKHTEPLDWQVVLHDNDWTRSESLAELVGTSAPAREQVALRPPRARWRARFLWCVATLVVIATSLAAIYFWRPANAGYEQIRAELVETIVSEAWRVPSGKQAAGTQSGVFDDPVERKRQIVQKEKTYRGASSTQEVTIGAVELLDDMAMVRVHVSQADANPDGSYRVMRYYRAVNGRWLPITPNSRFWGRQYTLETSHFQFHYYGKDGSAVRYAAEHVDAIYNNLRRDLGLSPARGAGEPVRKVEVVADIPSRYLFFAGNEDSLFVLSPLVLRIPADVSDGDILLKSVVHQLVRDTMHEASDEGAVHSEWSTLIQGIQLWQAHAGSDSLPAWQANTLAWHYHDLSAIRAGESTPSLRDLQRLCREYDIWGANLAANLSLGSLCVDADWSARLRYMTPASTTLSALAKDMGSNDSMQRRWTDSIAALSMIEYLTETYGRDRLPQLMNAVRLYDSWDMLIPQVVGVSPEEFEVGWNSYVTTRYAKCGNDC